MSNAGSSISAFGIDHDYFPVAKANQTRKRKETSGAAIAGGGAVTAGAGFAGGGLPGTKATRLTGDVMSAPARKKPGELARSRRAGIFGYRVNAHQTLRNFELTPRERDTEFSAARRAGKIGPEEKIIRHMQTGKKVSHGLLVGGIGATAYGVHRSRRAKREGVSKKDRNRRRNAALMGGGGTAAAGGVGLSNLLNRQGRKWSRESAASLGEAGKHIPELAGHSVKQGKVQIKQLRRLNMKHRVPDVEPTVHPRGIKPLLAGKSKAQVEGAGKHLGAATQQRYFANVYGTMATGVRRTAVPAGAAVAAAGGLAAYKSKKRNGKSST